MQKVTHLTKIVRLDLSGPRILGELIVFDAHHDIRSTADVRAVCIFKAA